MTFAELYAIFEEARAGSDRPVGIHRGIKAIMAAQLSDASQPSIDYKAGEFWWIKFSWCNDLMKRRIGHVGEQTIELVEVKNNWATGSDVCTPRTYKKSDVEIVEKTYK